MADKRPPALKLPTVHKPPAAQALPPTPPAQQEQDTVQNADPVQQDPSPTQIQVPNPVQPPAPPVQVPNPVQPQLNWSYSKPEFSDKLEEDAEAHLLRPNDWMEIHNFSEVAKVQRFCLTLTGQARLWYESLRPIVIDWTGLQEQFRQQYLKFGYTLEQLFHVWR